MKNDEKLNIFLQNSMQTNGLYATEADDRQEDFGEDMEADGQSSEAVSTEQDEPQKQSAIHS